MSVTVTGPGRDTLTVTRAAGVADDFRIFRIWSTTTVTINGLTMANGRSTSNGGGIYTEGNVYLFNSAVKDCRASGTGGGIYVSGAGSVGLYNSIVSGNRADGNGGGIFASGSTDDPPGNRIEINDKSQIYNNTSINGAGGGIYIGKPFTGRSDRLYIGNSTINQNVSQLEGGGLYIAATQGGQFQGTISESEVDENRSVTSSAGAVFAGGELTCTSSDFDGNSGAAGAGYAITILDGVPVTFDRCSIANNRFTGVGTDAAAVNCPGTDTSSVLFKGSTVSGNSLHGVSGIVRSNGGNYVEDSATTSVGWLPPPDDLVT